MSLLLMIVSETMSFTIWYTKQSLWSPEKAVEAAKLMLRELDLEYILTLRVRKSSSIQLDIELFLTCSFL